MLKLNIVSAFPTYAKLRLCNFPQSAENDFLDNGKRRHFFQPGSVHNDNIYSIRTFITGNRFYIPKRMKIHHRRSKN